MTITNVFETRNQLLAFRARWKQLYADGFHKPVAIEQSTGWGNTRKVVGYHQVSPLDGLFHLVRKTAIGKDPEKGFANAEGLSSRYPCWSPKVMQRIRDQFPDLFTDAQWEEVCKRTKEFAYKH